MLTIQLLRADVSSLKLDAIVAPADERGRREHDGRPFVTTGGNLLARFIIHVDVPSGSTEKDAQRLHEAVLAAFERGEELAIASVGLPLLTNDPSGLPLERVANIMLSSAFEHRSRARSLQRAIFCLFGKREYDVFERVLKELGQ